EFPEVSSEDLRVSGAEIFGHVPTFPEESYNAIQAFYLAEQQGDGTPLTRQLFHTFLELYLEHFNPQFPFLHTSKLEKNELPWVLMLAITAIGSQYSEMTCSSRITLVLRYLLSRAITSMVGLYHTLVIKLTMPDAVDR